MIWMMDLEVLEHAENKRHLEVMQFYSERMDSKTYELGPVLEFKVAHHVYKCGIEVGVTSLKNGGSQSWIVISWSVNKHVDELREENGTSIHFKEVTTRAGGPVATKTEGTIESTITFILEDVCADQSTEVERHSCRRLRR